MHRLFVALRPPRLMRERLLGVMGGIAQARWQDDDQLHLTLRFIGEVDTRLAEDVALSLAGVRHPPLALALDGVGSFDRRGRTDSVWAGVAPKAAVAALHRKVDHALVRAGLAAERRAFLPHLTIARLPRGAGAVAPFLAEHAALAGPPAPFDRFHLYESDLGASGATYTIVASYPLA